MQRFSIRHQQPLSTPERKFRFSISVIWGAVFGAIALYLLTTFIGLWVNSLQWPTVVAVATLIGLVGGGFAWGRWMSTPTGQ